MNTNFNAFEGEITSLSPEILLKIFLNLDSHETVILRSVCKEFLEIIDNNKSLWRILDWKQQEKESPIQALETFDEKSSSTLKEVSIFQDKGELDNERFVEVLRRSKESLVALSFNVCDPEAVRNEVLKLAASAPLLNSLIIWPPSSYWASFLPRTRLTRISSYSSTNHSNKLQFLWCLGAVEEWEGKLDVSSLVSFADPFYQVALQVRSFISNFSKTLIHLSMNSSKGIDTPSLSCPSLRILEGQFSDGFPSWLDAPNLRVVIASSVFTGFLRELPLSVEELWLLSWDTSLTTERKLGFLSSVCPQLRIVKLGKELFDEGFDTGSLLESLKAREKKAREGVKIEGIKMRSLEKLIVPTELLEPAQLATLREVVNEVIDVKDYPDFIKLEY